MKRVLITLLCATVMCGAAGVALAGPHANTDAVLALHVSALSKKLGCGTVNNPTVGTLAVLPPNYDTSYDVALTTTAGFYAWLMVAKADAAGGVAGLSCGIDWQMLEGDQYAKFVVAWSRCADLEFPSAGVNGNWPAPGGGNRITWAAQTNCQRSQVDQPVVGKCTALAGFFYITPYSFAGNVYDIRNGYIRITTNNNVPTPELAVADCAAVETPLPATSAGWAGLNAGGCPGLACMVPGCNPYNGPCEPPVPVRETTWGAIKALRGE